MKLTQRTVDTLDLPKGKSEAIIFDEDLPGFGLRMRAGGKRSWVYQFKIGNQHRRMTLGSATALSPAKARETASKLHAQVRLGRDPSAEKVVSRARAAETMAAVLPSFLDYQRARLKPRSMVETERNLKKNAKPLHSLQLVKIDRRTIAGRVSAVASEKGGPTANRMRATLSKFFGWAIQEGLLDSNPVIGTNQQMERSRDRVLSNDELKQIWNALEGSTAYSAIVRILMLTGARANEIGALRWSEIVGDKIVLPGARTKNGREHVIPITAAVQAILDECPCTRDVILGRSQGFHGWAWSKMALDRRIKDSGVRLEHWTHHDLRRTMATRMAETGTAPHIIEAILNHVSGHKAGVAGIYNRASYEPQKRIALQKWASYVEALVSGKLASKVVNLHR